MTSVGGQERALSVLRWLTLASLAILTAGFIVLLAYCVLEASRSPGSSVVDAYWVGRLPWIAVAAVMITVGATVSALVGGTTTMWAGGERRVLLPPPLLLVAIWWFTALAMSSMNAVPCMIGEPCPVGGGGPDPVAFAYSTPMDTLLFLILPALFVVALALVRRRQGVRPSAV